MVGSPLRFLSVWIFVLAACADGESFGRRDTGPHDAPPSMLDTPAPGLDAPIPPGVDAPVVIGTDAPVVIGTDAPVVIGTDAPIVTPTDAPVTGTGAYLDRCTSGASCASGICEHDLGTTSFCSRSCTSDAQCAFEHICIGGRCLADDTGSPCSVGAPDGCASGMCLGGAGGGSCVRTCANASECPAGFACTTITGSASRLCIDIERPCTPSGSECGSGLCDPALGCTALCRNAADCPRTLPSLEYTCAFNAGAGGNVCVPSAFVEGDDPIGSFCPAVGTVECRSGACDTDALPAPSCVQSCTPQGGCPPGSGCFPLADGAMFTLVCERAGGRDLGESCANARDCHSALCDGGSARCTRLCGDGFCPTGWSCTTTVGVSICRP